MTIPVPNLSLIRIDFLEPNLLKSSPRISQAKLNGSESFPGILRRGSFSIVLLRITEIAISGEISPSASLWL